ncbi:MAG TPA: photosystem I assembly protein Ycf4 [Cyanobacteria bacterium UBA8156]|nr:photosystem I assembly protein Ycf4 [Cyanobacteria bacterium UBA8156]
MTATNNPVSTQTRTLTYTITGARRPSNFVFAAITAIGGVGFLLAGLSSYTAMDLLPGIEQPLVNFVPQGLALSFYGVAGTLLDFYLWFAIAIDYGGGFNEFDLDKGQLRMVRKGMPGRNRTIDLAFPLAEVQAVRAEIRNGINPRRSLYLRLKGRKDLPLTEVGQPMPLSELEDKAAELAKFLAVPLEGI